MDGTTRVEDRPEDRGEESGFRAPQACKIVGITYRQLDYWARTDLVLPTLQAAAGSGSQRLYSFNDLLQLRVVKDLLDAGLSLQRVRSAIDYLRNEVTRDWSQVTIVAGGDGVLALTSEEELFDLVRSGQGVLGPMVAVGKVRDQLAGELRQLRPERPEPGYVPGEAQG